MDIPVNSKYSEIVKLRKLEATYWHILNHRLTTGSHETLNLKGLVKSYKNLNNSLSDVLVKTAGEMPVPVTQELKTEDV